jgi:hypothetical protein
MNVTDVVDCVRVSVAFLIVFGAVPYLFVRIAPGDRNMLSFCATIVRTSLFGSIAAVVLGSMQICLPGSMLMAYFVLFALLLWMGGRFEPWRRPQAGAALLHRLLICIENRRSTPTHFRPAVHSRGGHVVREPAFVFFMAIAVAALSHSLHHVRFLNDESYARALSLQKLALGQDWLLDGSVAFLAPLVFLSSLDGATVVRFSGPLFIAVLALAGFAAIARVTGSSPVGLAASAILVIVITFSH